MDWSAFGQAILENIIVPITLILGSTLVGIVKVLGDRITKSIVSKNEMESLEKLTATKANILSELSTIVDAAVASNMQLANKMKENGKKLTEDQILELNQSAKTLISNALSPSLTESDGVLLDLFGGQEKLDSVISSMMEKFVIEEKQKFPPPKAPDPIDDILEPIPEFVECDPGPEHVTVPKRTIPRNLDRLPITRKPLG